MSQLDEGALVVSREGGGWDLWQWGGRGGVRAWQCQLLRQEPRPIGAIPVAVSGLQNNGNVARVSRLWAAQREVLAVLVELVW
jgi:hypothetical protein